MSISMSTDEIKALTEKYHITIGTILSAEGVPSEVVAMSEHGVLRRYPDGGEEFISWTTLEYRLNTRDTCVIR